MLFRHDKTCDISKVPKLVSPDRFVWVWFCKRPQKGNLQFQNAVNPAEHKELFAHHENIHKSMQEKGPNSVPGQNNFPILIRHEFLSQINRWIRFTMPYFGWRLQFLISTPSAVPRRKSQLQSQLEVFQELAQVNPNVLYNVLLKGKISIQPVQSPSWSWEEDSLLIEAWCELGLRNCMNHKHDGLFDISLNAWIVVLVSCIVYHNNILNMHFVYSCNW